MSRVTVVAVALVTGLAAPAWGQPPSAPAGGAPPDASAANAPWTWSVETNVFAGYNYQRRKFTDFDAWESQNWIMANARRRAGPWSLSFVAGATLEPFTLPALGSPQVFQTGETYRNAPLIDYQHPHDLVMHLGADVTRTVGSVDVTLGAAIVGGPPIGPPAFMHRASAIENPQVPLSHHQLDATHITHGMAHTAVSVGGFRLAAAVFRGREPDERRTNLELNALDSQAIQATYTRGRWSAQISTAWLTRPERLSTYDSERRTASVSYTRDDGARVIAWTLAVGQNREVHGTLDAFLVEGVIRPSSRWATFTRLEWLDKDILDAGFHPVGVGHQHRQSRVGALTLGGVRDLATGARGHLGIGADVTVYRVPANLQEAYGSPLSTHVFLRLRGRAGAATPHRHD